MHCVTDTHSFLWYLTENPKLSSKARVIFDLCDQSKLTVIIPAIVLLEKNKAIKKFYKKPFGEIMVKLK